MMPEPMVPIRILDQEKRYQILKQIGQGGMGYVYEAIDTSVGKRRVAIKTLRDRPTEESLAMFEREIETLARVGDDDNIVSIINIGECEQDRIRKPYLVMPFLEGQTLDQVLRSGERLSVERSVRIILQVCHGLQAAHEKGIVHRDIKPSNIFLRANDKVKIIDFGLARMVDARTSMGRKGTFRYMSPEQIAGDEVDHRSDLFSLGVVLYELLTRTHPFGLNSAVESDLGALRAAIERKKPILIKVFNADVNDSLCYVGHKALQKDPRFRFQAAAGMADDLEKVLRNEPLPHCNLDKIGPVLHEAKEALELGKLDEASDILDDLEGRGYWHSRIEEVRDQLQQAKTTGQIEKLLQQATEYIGSDKPKLALNNLRRVLAIDPEQKEAKRLVTEVERLLADRDLASLLESAQAAMENEDFDVSEQLVKNVLSCRPNHPLALQLSKHVGQRRALFEDRKHQEDAAYEKAVKAFQSGDVSAAFRNAEELARLAHFDKHPDPRYTDIYAKVRSTHDFLLRKYSEAEKLMEERRLHDAKRVCEEVLSKYPNDIGCRALLNRISHREIEFKSAEIAAILATVNNEPNIDRKVEILEQGLREHPKEIRLEEAIRSAKELGAVVKSVVDAARDLEYRQDFEGAEAQLETLKRIYPLYPGLDFQLARLREKHHDHLKEKARAGIIEEIRRYLSEGLFDQAIEVANSSREFQDDPSVQQLKKEALLGVQRLSEVKDLCSRAELCMQTQQVEDAIPLLEQATSLAPQNVRARKLLVDSLYVLAARRLDGNDVAPAGELLGKLLSIDRNHEQAKALLAVVLDWKRKNLADQKRQESINGILDEVHRLEGEKTLPALRKALTLVKESPHLDATASLLECREKLEKKLAEVNESLAQYEVRINQCFEQHDLETALDLIRQALEIDPEDQRLLVLQRRVGRRIKLQRLLKPVKRVPLYRAAGILALVAVALTLGYGTYRVIINSRAPAQLTINSVPAGARVFIDGLEKGTTPLTLPIPIPSSTQRISVKFVLAGYPDEEQFLTLEPGKRDYALAGTMTKAPPSPEEEAFQSAQLSYDRLLQMSPENDDFLSEIDKFIGAINQIPGTSADQSELRGQALNLSAQLKSNLKEKLSAVPTETGNGQLLLEAISRIDPNDEAVTQRRDDLPRLKDQIRQAIQRKVFLTSEAGGALTPLKRLITRYPAEDAYYRAQLKEIRSQAMTLLREKCQTRTPDCQRYADIARIDFPNDPEIVRILNNAPIPPVPPPPPTPPVTTAVPRNTAVEASMTQTSQRMENAFSQKRYVMPADDSSVQLASRIIELGGGVTSPYELSREASLLVVRARDLRGESLRLAALEAGRLAQAGRYVQAVTSRNAATEVRAELELSQKMIEALSGFGGSPELTALSARIRTWLAGLQRLLESRQYSVSHGHSLGSCNGTLTIDGFGIEYFSSERPADNFQIPYTSSGTSGEAANTQQFEARRDGDSLVVRRSGSNRGASSWRLKYRQTDASPNAKANEMQQSIEEFLAVRRGILQAGQR
jgi:serine/threonine protein kinase